MHILVCRLLVNFWPSIAFGVLDLPNLLLWLFEVDVEIMWHIVVPTLNGSDSLSQVSGLNNGNDDMMTSLTVSLRGVFDNIILYYIPGIIACWNINVKVALLQSKQIHFQGLT